MKSGKVLLPRDRLPYGYRLSDDGKMLVVYEPEARIVRLIFTWYAEGDERGKRLGAETIARKLTEMGVPTWQDTHKRKFNKKRGPGEWAKATVVGILGNETYIGLWHYGRCVNGKKRNPRSYWLTVEVPAIIPRELWDKVQTQRERNKAMAKRNTRHNYLVGQRVTCGRCSHKIYGRSARKDKNVYLYYICAARYGKIVGQTCDSSIFRADVVDAAVWNWVKSFLSDPAALQSGLDSYQAEKERENAPLRERLKVVEDLLDDNRAQLQRLLDLYLAGDFPKEMLVERKNRLEKTMESLEKERASFIARLEKQTLSGEQIQSIKDFAAEVAGGLEHADEDFETRRQIIDALDVRATLAVEDGEKVVYVRCIIGDNVLSIANTTTKSLYGQIRCLT